ncbi:MAG: hypothetical protein CSYNP_03103 [Syntrophus sp. SKADARSKE-3]|nr:hypothetical protein [Syntrophus sp. SKADARSKE-3]
MFETNKPKVRLYRLKQPLPGLSEMSEVKHYAYCPTTGQNIFKVDVVEVVATYEFSEAFIRSHPELFGAVENSK